ncbi:MAG: ABC transporter ATP-binding protein [Kiloniellaceae bacterium]
MSELEIDVREKRYPAVGEAAAHVALKDVRITARHGEFICVLGPSGCGKTTLLNIIAGLDRNFEGRVRPPPLPGRSEAVVGYVFQEPRLLPWYTVARNIELVLSPAQVGSGIVDELLVAAGLDGFRNAYPQRLSLGMSRRVALVRAFAVQPDLLLMDEPFVSLDAATAQHLRALLLEILNKQPTTVLFVSHNVREAIFLADRIILLSAAPGTVLADIPVRLSREARKSPAQVEAFRARLTGENPLLCDGL